MKVNPWMKTPQIIASMDALVLEADQNLTKQQARGIVNYIIQNRFPVCLPQYLEEAKAIVCSNSEPA